MENIFAYNLHYKISQEDTGSVSCMYQFKDLKNRSNNSGLSNAIDLQQVLGKKIFQKSILSFFTGDLKITTYFLLKNGSKFYSDFTILA